MTRIILLLFAAVLSVGAIHDAVLAHKNGPGVGAWIVKVPTHDLFWVTIAADLLLALICVIGAFRVRRT